MQFMKYDHFIHWPEDKASNGSLKLGYYPCFLKCWTITRFSSWEISPEQLKITLSVKNVQRTKHAHTGRNWAWLYPLKGKETKKFQILHKESMWSDKYNCWQKQLDQLFFQICLCDFQETWYFPNKD